MRVFLSPAILKNRRVTVFDYLPDDLEVLAPPRLGHEVYSGGDERPGSSQGTGLAPFN